MRKDNTYYKYTIVVKIFQFYHFSLLPLFDSLMHPVNYVAKDVLSTACLHFTSAVIAGKLHPGYIVLRTESGFCAARQQPAKLDISSAFTPSFTYSPTATTRASYPLMPPDVEITDVLHCTVF